ncbi:MAG TPA: competence/damage-inducible protein A [Pyrinomonadaceae bacterium]|nr:competence/damage-inducible protein A [Pyrinomonadaceae bacterium]
MFSAEIIAVGSELLTPEKTDTNSLWLTEKLNSFGVEVMLKTIVGDDEARLEEVIRDALKRSDVVITTGGLGPTEDDITRPVAARAVGRQLVYQPELETDLRERFRLWGREMPEINKRQAYAIDGAEVLPNPNGSAVGMMLADGRKLLIVLPGPPRELKPMFENHIAGRIAELSGEVVVRRRVLKVSGMGESALDELIAPLYRGFEGVQTSILFNKSEVEVHLTAKAKTEAQATALLEDLSKRLSDVLGLSLFATNGEKLEEVVGSMLRENGKTLAVAESCTGGLIAMRLTDVPGSSAYFLEGAITYANQSKMRVLNVSEATLAEYGAVSGETAEEMARGIRQSAGSDYGISVTGIAGPDGGSDDKPVGTVFIGYSDVDETRSVKFVFPGDRYLIRWRSSQAALDYLRRRMIKRIAATLERE